MKEYERKIEVHVARQVASVFSYAAGPDIEAATAARQTSAEFLERLAASQNRALRPVETGRVEPRKTRRLGEEEAVRLGRRATGGESERDTRNRESSDVK